MLSSILSGVPSQLQVSCGPGVTGGYSSGPAHITPGSKLHSSHVTYLVHAIIGEGTYGKIAKCTRKDTNSMVALKIIKNNSNFIEQANDEVGMNPSLIVCPSFVFSSVTVSNLCVISLRLTS